MSGPFSNLPASLSSKLLGSASRAHFDTGEVILREGQFVKVIPIVIEGLVKVYTRYEDRELLLYYITPDESCIMSFASGFHGEPSRVYAQTEAPTDLLLLPVSELSQWVREHPQFTELFLGQYKKRYSELLETVHQVLFDRLDLRLYDHLKRKAALKSVHRLSISHQQLADELGTVREVISRTVKKLEVQGLVRQDGQSIEILKSD
jgi:CRP/FNR family transcriptional regulator